MNFDCGFTKENNWFRYRAAGIIVEDNKLLLIGSKKADYLYTVGGGVYMNETSSDCVKREIFEETGMNYEIDHLAVIIENFFVEALDSFENKNCHCIEFLYLMKPNGFIPSNANDEECTNGKEFIKWIPLANIKDYNIKPIALVENINRILESKEIIHIVNKE